MRPLRLAADTNVLLNQADGVDDVVDALRIIFRDAPIEESDEDKPGVILDYDPDGNVVGLEVLNASRRVAELWGL